MERTIKLNHSNDSHLSIFELELLRTFIDNFCSDIENPFITKEQKIELFEQNKEIIVQMLDVFEDIKNHECYKNDNFVSALTSTITNLKKHMKDFEIEFTNENSKLNAGKKEQEKFKSNYAVIIKDKFIPLYAKDDIELLKIINKMNVQDSIKAYRLTLENIPLRKEYVIDK